ncbi:winged helix-turn-helix domain-containing protein [Embleya scabrispora]|uniref:winged helix-turn-helix domain-containing protein n=1 Tax=Embleya scabrispora TaxID=159449 RepID=UPI001374EADD
MFEAGPEAAGFTGYIWTLARAGRVITRVTGVVYASPSSVWRLLRAHGWSRQRPVDGAARHPVQSVDVLRRDADPEPGERSVRRAGTSIDDPGRGQVAPHTCPHARIGPRTACDGCPVRATDHGSTGYGGHESRGYRRRWRCPPRSAPRVGAPAPAPDESAAGRSSTRRRLRCARQTRPRRRSVARCPPRFCSSSRADALEFRAGTGHFEPCIDRCAPAATIGRWSTPGGRGITVDALRVTLLSAAMSWCHTHG